MQTKEAIAQDAQTQPEKRKFKRLHQETCGGKERFYYDGYEDVRDACERRLAQWAREGVLIPYASAKANDWLFG